MSKRLAEKNARSIRDNKDAASEKAGRVKRVAISSSNPPPKKARGDGRAKRAPLAYGTSSAKSNAASADTPAASGKARPKDKGKKRQQQQQRGTAAAAMAAAAAAPARSELLPYELMINLHQRPIEASDELFVERELQRVMKLFSLDAATVDEATSA
ncbi:unnamed protein product, partial [Phaeothamnion confervicola]